LSGELRNLDRLELFTKDKKTALLLVLSINPFEFFSYREAAHLVGQRSQSNPGDYEHTSGRVLQRIAYRARKHPPQQNKELPQ
jgi:hypothetical protein